MRITLALGTSCLLFLALMLPNSARGSSHMDAPGPTKDPSANTTDVYAFVTENEGEKFLSVALGVYPHQEPGIGPNNYNFDDDALYEIHVAFDGGQTTGEKTISYQFQFETTFVNEATILASFLDRIEQNGDAGQNLEQTYTVTRVDHRTGVSIVLGTGIVPPNNQGVVTPFYNEGDDGENPARDGVATPAELDRYTLGAVQPLIDGYVAFAGQRDDGFYADIQSIFDRLNLRDPGQDSQGGFNIHLMALQIPVSELGGDQKVAGVYATTSRKELQQVRDAADADGNGTVDLADTIYHLRFLFQSGPAPIPPVEQVWVQVARQGNPLFCEGLVAVADKDRYNQTSPTEDAALFAQYANEPELAALINALILGGAQPGIAVARTDILGIFIPDLIRVDLSTSAARLAGSGPAHPTNPDDADFSRLGIFGGDVLISQIQDPFNMGGAIPGGWPNGRRFGDDVVDIAIDALLSDLRVLPPVIATFPPGDGVPANDLGFNKVFPYASTPQNGRNHTHP